MMKRKTKKQMAMERELADMNAEQQRLLNKHGRSNYEEASLRVVTNRINYLTKLLNKE